MNVFIYYDVTSQPEALSIIDKIDKTGMLIFHPPTLSYSVDDKTFLKNCDEILQKCKIFIFLILETDPGHLYRNQVLDLASKKEKPCLLFIKEDNTTEILRYLSFQHCVICTSIEILSNVMKKKLTPQKYNVLPTKERLCNRRYKTTIFRFNKYNFIGKLNDSTHLMFHSSMMSKNTLARKYAIRRLKASNIHRISGRTFERLGRACNSTIEALMPDDCSCKYCNEQNETLYD